MLKKDVLEELSISLSEKERVTLLERINRNMNINPQEKEVQDEGRSKKEREIHIENELKHLGWFRKLIMLIISKLSGKKLEEIVVESMMKKLKKTISRKQPGLTGFESRNLTPLFGEMVFELFAYTFEFHELYRKLWLEPGVYESCCQYIVSSMYKETKIILDDFISLKELVDLYAESGRKDFLVEEVDRKIKEYCDDIPVALYDEIENSIEPLYDLKDIILFPYIAFFKKFSFTPIRSDDQGKHFFKNASVMLCLDDLKMLYKAFMSGAMLDDDAVINKYLIEFIRSLGDENAVPKSDQNVLNKLIVKVKEYNRNVPILELLRFFRKDPFLQIKISSEKKSFKDVYAGILHAEMKNQVDLRYSEIQAEYIEREIGRIFKDQPFAEFRNYRKYASIDYQKMGLPYFSHIKSLNVLYNYIKCFYQSHLQDLISILEKGVLSQNRITRDRLLNHSIALQELEDKINSSDNSLSPDGEDGKLFHKLRMTLAAEPSQQRMFRSLVKHKNKEVQSLIEWGEEALAGLERIFDELVGSTSNVVKVQLNKHYLFKGKSTTLVSLLKTRAKHIREIRNLISKINKLESN
ncbi:MAG: hypothetical protein JEZ04_02090 [Spirochaetales bacterium]|nr:hypothetical protein [Spirochaetales bacterium]